ncbi:MAG TPA: alpha-amylase family glycosyl hydrolase [Methylomirabilota bacterium]|nr:alpha-amylase family glycosyl hydrolase [Methylomirabilota bacterium]
MYQVYPRSFQDGNADGVGDLRGIRQRLPYLGELGIDAAWISPIYPSPMADFGYDISDYTGVDPIFGSLEEFDALLAAAHAQGLRILLDLVPNHTSDQHPWFRESRASRQSARRDWYIWRDPAPDGGPPNNWLSNFGGSAWERDEATRQYYYHAFLAAQPDLNWRNPAVREAMHEVMRFWLRRGVDGFRVDVIWHLLKDDQFRDNPPNPAYQPGEPPHHVVLPVHTADLPEVHEAIAGMRRTLDEFPDRVLIGEIYLPIERLMAYYGRDLGGTHMPFNFALLSTPWRAREIAKLIDDYEAALPPGGWPNWVLGNHDRPRIAGRVGPAQARIAAMLLLTLRGTPTVYYGDEIGMTEVPIPPDRVRDPFERNVPGIGCGRDGARTPMQWDATAHAGFSTAEPWLPVADGFGTDNVEHERLDPASMLHLYRRLIAARRHSVALQRGDYRPIVASGDLLVYVRQHANERMLVGLNLGRDAAVVKFPDRQVRGEIIVSSAADRDGQKVEGELSLRGDEGVVVSLTPGVVVPRSLGEIDA